MIFVTVGTHEQPFDRIVKAIDALKERDVISQEVFIQTGYSSYKPRYCEHSDFIGFNRMIEQMQAAEIVLTHGGTGSIMLALYNQKIPVVMPRQKKYHEHIDDHQVHFCKKMESKGKIIAVYEVEDLGPAVSNYSQRVKELQKNGDAQEVGRLNERAGRFARELNDICTQLIKKK